MVPEENLLARRFVTGKGQYLADLDIPDMVHVSFVRSQVAHAKINSMTLAGNQDRLISGSEFMEQIEPLRIEGTGVVPYDWYPISEHAYYVGEPIGMVYGGSPYEAEDLKYDVDVEYQEIAPIVDIHASLISPVALHKEVPHNILYHKYINKEYTKDIFRKCYIQFEHTFNYGRQSAAPLEGRGVIAKFDSKAETLTVWSSTQNPWGVRTAISKSLKIENSKVRVIRPDVGGTFGQKAGVYAEEIALAWLSIKLNRPVKWVEDRSENLTSGQPSHETEITVKLGADKEGRILAVKANIMSDCGAHHLYPFGASIIPATASTSLFSVYRVGVAEMEITGIATNKATLGSYRGVGMNGATFATERMMDILAHKLSLDPAELRLKNLLTKEEFPHEGPVGQILDSGDYKKTLELALKSSQYSKYISKHETSVGMLSGIGIGCFNEHSGTSSKDYAKRGVTSMASYDAARIKVLADGSLEFNISTAASGQGHDELIRKLLSKRLGVNPAKIVVNEADTELCPEGFGTGVDRGAIAISELVFGGVNRLLEIMVNDAKRELNIEIEFNFADVRFVTNEQNRKHISFHELVNIIGRHRNNQDVVFEVTHVSDLENQVFSNGAHIAQIEIDPGSFAVKVLKYFVVIDCGHVLDWDSVYRQVIGGIGQGIGMALLEEMKFTTEGQVITGSLMDYLVPLSIDMPYMDVRFLEHPSPFTTGGVKGVGQVGAVASGAAIANAIANALGLSGPEPSNIPLSPQRIFEFIEQSSNN